MTQLDAIERTCLLTAALRAGESRRDDRLYHDPYAQTLVGDAGPELLAEIRSATFPDGEVRARCRAPSTSTPSAPGSSTTGCKARPPTRR
ncbi:class I SAM-dependent methyltransferase [Streptomyces sp. FXJ1.4098]|nr:class I SAM-dependent methyltransferase [Streptomyces sp. FXJ1.4098]